MLRTWPVASAASSLLAMSARHWAYLVFGALLALLLFAWLRRRRRRARRNTLRVWHPANAQRPVTAALPEAALAPPPWLANATRDAGAASPAPAVANATTSADSTVADLLPTAAVAAGNEVDTAAAAAAVTAPTRVTAAPRPVEPVTAPPHAAEPVSAPPRAAEPATAPPRRADPAPPASTAPAVAPAVTAPATSSHATAPRVLDAAPSAPGFATHVASIRGAALGPQPVPRVSVHIGSEAQGHLAAPAGAVTATADSRPEAFPVDTEAALELSAGEAIDAATALADDPAPAASNAAAYVQARRLAAQDRPGEALALLRPLLDAQAPATAWAMAGWCAWKLAQGEGDRLPAAIEATRAFGHALAADPSRRTTLSRMIGRCHLLQAEADSPARRHAHLTAAAQAYAQGFADTAAASGAALLEWANALAALATQSSAAERAAWLAQLDAVLARGPHRADASPAWCRLHAQAAWLRAATAPAMATRTRWHAEAVAHLQRGHGLLHDPQARDQWLAESIEAERRYLATQSPAGRVAGHASLAARMRGPLGDAQGAAPWLAWVHVLADGARVLQGPAAGQRLAEAEAVFARLRQMPATAGERQGIEFARAYYLRQRAAHERGWARQQLLDEASQVLAALRDSDFEAVAGVALEQAELALMQAASDAQPQARYRQAVAHASFAADVPATRVPAFRTLLTALLAWHQQHPEPAHVAQIAMVAQWLAEADIPPAAETLRLRAAAALLRQDMAEAAHLSAAAWEAGGEPREVLPGWRQADAAWARSLADADRGAWEQQHRQLLLASGTR